VGGADTPLLPVRDVGTNVTRLCSVGECEPRFGRSPIDPSRRLPWQTWKDA
jgi:hypothetical protein